MCLQIRARFPLATRTERKAWTRPTSASSVWKCGRVARNQSGQSGVGWISPLSATWQDRVKAHQSQTFLGEGLTPLVVAWREKIQLNPVEFPQETAPIVQRQNGWLPTIRRGFNSHLAHRGVRRKSRYSTPSRPAMGNLPSQAVNRWCKAAGGFLPIVCHSESLISKRSVAKSRSTIGIRRHQQCCGNTQRRRSPMMTGVGALE